jgi:hypothetical protein
MKITVKVEGEQELQRKLALLAQKAGQIVDEATRAGADVWQEESNRLAPGPHVAQMTTRTTLTAADVQIGPDKEHWYYIFFETGATAHEITPSVRKAVRFEVGADAVFAMRVRHTGMAAAPFLRPPATNKRDAIIAAMKAKFLTAVNEVVNS